MSHKGHVKVGRGVCAHEGGEEVLGKQAAVGQWFHFVMEMEWHGVM